MTIDRAFIESKFTKVVQLETLDGAEVRLRPMSGECFELYIKLVRKTRKADDEGGAEIEMANLVAKALASAVIDDQRQALGDEEFWRDNQNLDFRLEIWEHVKAISGLTDELPAKAKKNSSGTSSGEGSGGSQSKSA